MKIPSEEELVELLETCWSAASRANIGTGPMLFEQKDQLGRPFVDNIRTTVFYNMVNTLLLKSVRPGEPWEGEE